MQQAQQKQRSNFEIMRPGAAAALTNGPSPTTDAVLLPKATNTDGSTSASDGATSSSPSQVPKLPGLGIGAGGG